MIRWKFVIPRLTLFVALVLTLGLGASPALKWAIVASGQQVTGAKIDLDRVRANWLHGRVRLEGIQVADPKSPLKNLVQAESAELDLSATQLLRRQLVIQQASLEGVAIGQSRDVSGALPSSPGQDTENDAATQWSSQAQAMVSDRLDRWFDELADMSIEEIENRFETPRVASELAERWPQEYQNIATRIDRLESQYDDLRQYANLKERNPLRIAQVVSTASKDVQQSLKDIDELYRALQQLKDQIPIDKQRLMDAKTQDTETIQSIVRAPKVTADEITESLFGNQQLEQLQQAVTWVQWIRNAIPKPVEDFQAERSKGVDVQFRKDRLRPAILVELANISGTLPADEIGKGTTFHGSIKNLSTHPGRIESPIELSLKTDDEEQVQLEATLDRTQEKEVDRIRLVVPAKLQRARELGSQKTVLLELPESRATVKLDLTIVDKELRGRLLVEQSGEAMQVAHVDEQLGGTYVHGLLGSALESINEWDVEVAISGTMNEPEFKLSSSMGPKLEREFNALVSTLVEDQKQRLNQFLDDQIDKQMEQIEEHLQEVEQLTATIREIDRELSNIKQTVAGSVGSRLLR